MIWHDIHSGVKWRKVKKNENNEICLGWTTLTTSKKWKPSFHQTDITLGLEYVQLSAAKFMPRILLSIILTHHIPYVGIHEAFVNVFAYLYDNMNFVPWLSKRSSTVQLTLGVNCWCMCAYVRACSWQAESCPHRLPICRFLFRFVFIEPIIRQKLHRCTWSTPNDTRSFHELSHRYDIIW